MNLIKANETHFPEIITIYNWAIENTSSTFDTELKNVETYGPFLKSLKDHPLIVATDSDNVLGWGCLKPYSDRKAYDETVELSIYISPDHHGKGIGTELMKELLSRAQEYDFHTILSRITSESEASIKLHKKFGFKTVGIMKEVGLKFNRRVDVILMQIILQKS
tara:strand:+ start:104 stop:595 length:492 start_codon:yes stop_codon:yes gene_type:complete